MIASWPRCCRWVLVLLLGVAVTPLAGAAAPAAAAASCEVGKTRYIREPSDALRSLAIPQSWKLATGKGQVVAVVDSGVDTRNAHLSGGVVLPGRSFVSGAATEDPYGHGTAVAGVIAGQFLHGRSALIGAAPEAKILPVRVFEYEPTDGNEQVPFPPDTARLAAGIRWAAAHGADVINVSMSTGPKDPELPMLRAAVDFAIRKKDAVVVASVGNGDGSPQTEREYPAAFPGVIGVAAANQLGEVDDWSVHGPQVDVSAPGADVLIAFHANGDCLAGNDHPYTSWATPFVSALAAQLRERYPGESAARIGYRILASADRPRQGQRDDQEGWGEIRPYAALSMTLDPRREGPPFPGGQPVTAPAAHSDVRPLTTQPDALAPARRQALWWGLGALGLAGLALVLRPLARQRRGPG